VRIVVRPIDRIADRLSWKIWRGEQDDAAAAAVQAA
jgi:hypothetical protein